MKPRLTLRVHLIACDGRRECAEVLPELISLDDWGFPIIRASAVPDHLEGEAREADADLPKTCPPAGPPELTLPARRCHLRRFAAERADQEHRANLNPSGIDTPWPGLTQMPPQASKMPGTPMSRTPAHLPMGQR